MKAEETAARGPYEIDKGKVETEQVPNPPKQGSSSKNSLSAQVARQAKPFASRNKWEVYPLERLN